MKKFIFICLILFCAIPCSNLKAIDTLSIKYFPLHVGDFWVYNWIRTTSLGTTIEVRKTEVTGSVNLNSHLYYIVIGFPISSYPGCDTLRTE
jgi:hypothetical protein